MTLYILGDRRPRLASGAWVAPDASVIGHVILQTDASVWFQAVLRGDNEPITIGPRSNVQDGAVLHTDPGCPLTLHEGVTVGHQAMLHGCEVGAFSLVGIGARLLNRVRVGRHCLIGAHALLTEDQVIPDGSLVVGAPAKVLRSLTEPQRQMLEASAQHYVDNARRYRRELQPVTAEE
jgi:carbonic anhydrase/acetyltransferase-like protein (isoleucine patch superfamily)